MNLRVWGFVHRCLEQTHVGTEQSSQRAKNVMLSCISVAKEVKKVDYP